MSKSKATMVDGPVTPECEILCEGGPGSSQLFLSCKKNPGHKNFIPVYGLTIMHLPPEWRTPGHMQFIKSQCDLTVRIAVQYTSPDRPDTMWNRTTPYPYCDMKGKFHAQRVGTGCIEQAGPHGKHNKCPCRLCVRSQEPKMEYWEVKIFTSVHVVFDRSEAAHAVVDFMYDSDDEHGERLYGIDDGEIEVADYSTDCRMFPCVTHDKRLADRLEFLTTMKCFYVPRPRLGPRWGFIVSHPHGGSKHVSFGHVLGAKAWLWQRHLNDLNQNAAKSSHSQRVLLCRLSPGVASSVSPVIGNKAKEDASPLPQQQNSPVLGDKNTDEYDMDIKSALIEPGKKYKLPNETKFILPKGSNSKEIFESRLRWDKRGKWMTLPADSILTFPNGNSRCLQKDTELLWPEDTNGPLYCCLEHNIPTCPGTSGARLVYRKNLCFSPPHFGAAVGGANNITGYGIFAGVSVPDYTGIMDHIYHDY